MEKPKRRLQWTERCQSEVQLDKQPWLQLICCASVFSHKVGHLFWSEGKSSEQRS